MNLRHVWIPAATIAVTLGCSNLAPTQGLGDCAEGESRCAPEDLGAEEEQDPADTFDVEEVLPEDTAFPFEEEDDGDTGDDTAPPADPGGSTPILAADFETCPSGWTLQSPWQCGAPSSGPFAAAQGTGVLATNLSGDYPPSQDWFRGTATSPAFTVPAAGATLSFQAWWHFEFLGTFADGWLVAVVPTANPGDGQILTTNVPATQAIGWGTELPAWSQAQTSWISMTADLSPWAGQEIQLVFDMYAETSSWPEPGAYVDDLRVE